MVFTIALSGIAGLVGGYIASAQNQAHPIPRFEEALHDGADTQEMSGWNDEQLLVFLDEYLASIDSNEDDSSDYLDSIESISEVTIKSQMTTPEIAAFASASVVEIYTETVVNSGRMRQFISEGAGSGVIISTDGYIVTNNHVVEDSRRITVRLNNGKDYDAVLIGRDSQTDLAVLKINETELQPVVYGDSDLLLVAEPAVAIGNPLGKLGGSVTEGIISALSRNIEIDGHTMTLLQTSAAVNPGNSGGGLFNSYGELIGVVNAKSSGTDIEGIGFAIPINLVREIAESLIEYGYVPGRIDFGAILVNVLDSMTARMYRVQMIGVYVSQVYSDSDLQTGDLILSIDGIEVHSIADIDTLLQSYNVDDILSIEIFRNGSTGIIEHTLRQALS
jgi:serine protease Do